MKHYPKLRSTFNSETNQVLIQVNNRFYEFQVKDEESYNNLKQAVRDCISVAYDYGNDAGYLQGKSQCTEVSSTSRASDSGIALNLGTDLRF